MSVIKVKHINKNFNRKYNNKLFSINRIGIINYNIPMEIHILIHNKFEEHIELLNDIKKHIFKAHILYNLLDNIYSNMLKSSILYFFDDKYTALIFISTFILKNIYQFTINQKLTNEDNKLNQYPLENLIDIILLLFKYIF